MGKAYASLMARCQLAAPCSAEGRTLLIESLDQNDGMFGRYTALESLIGRLEKSDPHWSELMTIAKRYALDETADIGNRIKASILAAEDAEDGEYRDAFIRSALASNNPLLIEWVLGKFVLGSRDADKFFDEYSMAFDASPPLLRGRLLTILAMACPKPIAAENRAAFERFIAKAKRDENQTVRNFAETLGKTHGASDDSTT